MFTHRQTRRVRAAHFAAKTLRVFGLGWSALALSVGACAGAPAATPPAVPLWPMPTATQTNSAPATPAIIATPIPPTPLPTPVMYVVQKGDTLVVIAWQFGVSVEALQALNPSVDARFLSVGTVLQIPDPEGDPVATTAPPTPTAAPIALGLSVPACYLTPTQQLYCFVEALNHDEAALAGVTAQVILADVNGLPLAEAKTLSAVERMEPGQAVPLVAVFANPPAGVAGTQARWLTAYRVGAPTTALPLPVPTHTGAMTAAGWQVTGQVNNPTVQAVNTIWVTVTLYDAANAILGFRTEGLPGGLAAGGARDFSVTVVSLGGAVARYTVLAEARP